MQKSQLLVGIAEVQVSKGPAFYSCLGLGSCIAVAMIDPGNDVSGMVHIMLPKNLANRHSDKPGKFADTGIVALVESMEALGADRQSLRVAYAGGAQVFKFSQSAHDHKLEVGSRNAQAVESALTQLGLQPVASDLGGSTGRSVHFCSVTGNIMVRTVQGGEVTLCSLR